MGEKTIRAKFRCESKTQRMHWDRSKGNLFDYEFQPVCDSTGENKAFWEATPSGSLKLSCVLPDGFEVGREYYLDFTAAPATA